MPGSQDNQATDRHTQIPAFMMSIQEENSQDCAFKHKAWETVVVHPAKFLQRQLCKHSFPNLTGHLGCFSWSVPSLGYHGQMHHRAGI